MKKLNFKKLSLLEYIIYSAVIVGGIIIDQLTKLLAIKYLKPVGTVPIIEDILHLTFVTNDGMAFGMLDNHRWIFITVSIITISVLAFLLFAGKFEKNLYGYSIAMIVSGGIGNMIDRIALGEVTDFIDFRVINFAVFNFADTVVCVGAGILVLALILDIIEESKKNENSKNNNENNTGEDSGK